MKKLITLIGIALSSFVLSGEVKAGYGNGMPYKPLARPYRVETGHLSFPHEVRNPANFYNTTNSQSAPPYIHKHCKEEYKPLKSLGEGIGTIVGGAVGLGIKGPANFIEGFSEGFKKAYTSIPGPCPHSKPYTTINPFKKPVPPPILRYAYEYPNGVRCFVDKPLPWDFPEKIEETPGPCGRKIITRIYDITKIDMPPEKQICPKKYEKHDCNKPKKAPSKLNPIPAPVNRDSALFDPNRDPAGPDIGNSF